MPPTFDAFLGHKEAVRRLPEGAVLLASSADCPVHAFRIGRNVYATQFHPELDVEGLVPAHRRPTATTATSSRTRPTTLLAMARAAHVEHPPRLLARFVELYAC